MRKEIIQTGKTVDEAINSACARLGVKLENCEWDIIDLPKTAFFGLKKIPAKVKVWVEVEEEPVKKQPVKKETRPAAKKPEVKEAKPEAKQRKAKPQSAKPVVKKEQPAPPKEKEESKTNEPVVIKTESSSTAQRGNTPDDIKKMELAAEYVGNIVANMGVEGEIQTRWENEGLCVAVYGKRLGALIGRKGETLNAIQYLSGLAVNRLEGEYLRVTVDVGDYRLKRNNSLIELAEKSAEQVLKSDVSKLLEPMNPAERRIIHSAVSNVEGVSSVSVGNEPYRRVMIKTPTSKSKTENSRPRGANYNRGKDRNRSSNDKRRERPHKASRPEREVVSEAPENLPKISKDKVSETPLYGKIEL